MIVIVLMEEKYHLHLTQERRKLEICDYKVLRIPGPRGYILSKNEKYGIMEAIKFCILS
jgi:hypothetical protein